MRVVSRDFLNDNEYQKYPVDERATLEPYASSDVSAVNSLLTDMKLVVPGAVAACAFIASVKTTPALVTLTIMGSQTHPFSPNIPPATVLNEQYSVLGAFVLATVQVRRTSSLPGSIVHVQSEVPGVGGWVIFGSGVLTEGSWSFSGPEASMISDYCISRYEHGGVTTIGKYGFDTVIDGKVQMVGQNGVEVVYDSKGVAIQFSGPKADVKQGLQSFVGECGGRPESDTCKFRAIRSLNSLVPQGPDKELVIVLDKPLYARYEGTGEEEIVVISSDLPLEKLCKGRLQIPETCGGTSQGFIEFTSALTQPPVQGGVALNPDTRLTFEVFDGASNYPYSFAYAQQHPTRPSVAIFRTEAPIHFFGEALDSLHIDAALGEWQLYGTSGASLVAFGGLSNNLRAHREITHQNASYKITLGFTTIYDTLGVTEIAVGINAPDEFPEVGTYLRVGYGLYQHSLNPAYTLEIRSAPNDSWAIVADGSVLAAGVLSAQGVGTQVQNYTRSNGQPGIRTIGVTGAAS